MVNILTTKLSQWVRHITRSSGLVYTVLVRYFIHQQSASSSGGKTGWLGYSQRNADNGTNRQTNTHTDTGTFRLNCPWGRLSENSISEELGNVFKGMHDQTKQIKVLWFIHRVSFVVIQLHLFLVLVFELCFRLSISILLQYYRNLQYWSNSMDLQRVMFNVNLK